MTALILWLSSNRKWLMWCGLAALWLALWLYIAHLKGVRDQALNEVTALHKTLDDERNMAQALAQIERDKADAASRNASAALVQKKREMAQSYNALKKEINHVYHTKQSTTAGFGATQTIFDNAGGTTRRTGTVESISVDGTQEWLVGNDSGSGDACFGRDFKRLWNAANAGAGGAPSATTP